MAAPRPPSVDPIPETLDSSLTDETLPPARSPLRGALPFGGGGARPPPPSAQAVPGAPPPIPGFAVHGSIGEETAPPQRSPLAAALPFRRARPAAATVAIAMPTAADLERMAQGGANAAARATPRGAEGARAKAELAKTVGMVMPSPSPLPAGGGPVAAKSTGHFGLSIEQYAALCAEVAVSPQAADAIFTKYGLGARRDQITADLAWQERLRADNALMLKWQSLYLHYHEHYSRAARR